MIAVTADAEVGPAARCASAMLFARARIATSRPRRSPEGVAGVKRNSLLVLAPRRASAAASRGSETAGVNAPTGRALSAAAWRFALSLWVVVAKAGVSSSAIAISDALPAVPMALSLLKTPFSPLLGDLVRVERESQQSAASPQ